MIAKINKMWMNPPNVYELTIPNNHKISRRAAIVKSIRASFPRQEPTLRLQATQEAKVSLSSKLGNYWLTTLYS